MSNRVEYDDNELDEVVTDAQDETPARIRVAQDADGFWTCREAVSGSPEYVRSDLARPSHAGDGRVSRLVEAVETLIDAAGTAETTLAHALMDGMIDPNVEDRFDAWLQELIAAAHNGRAALAALDTPPAPDDTPSRTHYASGPEVTP